MCHYTFAHSPLSLKRSNMLALPLVLLLPVLHLLWQVFTTRSVTKAMPIQLIDGRSHMKKWRCCKTALSGYYAYFSCDVLLIPLGADTHTNTPTFADETISRNQARAAFGHAPGLKIVKTS